ncbi:aldehyde dehydrogenase family protein, partial [Streptomyces sp. NPDC058964]|uniref:aldehyde dehydrogenase family protein n=1 Tax=Streptomyces sp. NPDC058964 TaxID=3346681 RepID=UPI003681AE74
MARSVASIVAGHLVAGAPGGTLQRTNPGRTAELVTEVSLGDASTFVEAAKAAKAAQRSWADTPAPVRGSAIGKIGRLVEANKDRLARIVTAEIGKPLAAGHGVVQVLIEPSDLVLGEGPRLFGQTVPTEKPDQHQL